MTRRVLTLAHRGASGHAYENSREAFRRAIELGAQGVELDIHATADGTIVVHHDPSVPGLGAIADHDASAVARATLPNGETVPFLGEVLAILGDHEVWIEAKALPARFDANLLAELDHGPFPSRYAVHSFDHRIVARLGRSQPELRRGVLLASRPVEVMPILEAAGATVLWQVHHFVDGDLVARVHDAGADVIAWTANDAPEIERLVALGVDGICGNYPERIRAALHQRG